MEIKEVVKTCLLVSTFSLFVGVMAGLWVNPNQPSASNQKTTSTITEKQSRNDQITYKYKTGTITEAYCSRVIDGDTIEVKLKGEKHKVRLIGIDSPEVKNDDGLIEFYSQDATAYAKKRLLDKTIYLEGDKSKADKYGRMLAYVWISKPPAEVDENYIRDNMFNAMSVKNGYSLAYEYKPDTKYALEFKSLQNKAALNQYGQWNIEAQNKWNAMVEAQNSQTNQNDLGQGYIGNANTGKFHYPWCSSVDKMNESNKVWLNSRDEAINWGYVPCQRCNP